MFVCTTLYHITRARVQIYTLREDRQYMSNECQGALKCKKLGAYVWLEYAILCSIIYVIFDVLYPIIYSALLYHLIWDAVLYHVIETRAGPGDHHFIVRLEVSVVKCGYPHDYHPIFNGIFHEINHLAMGVPKNDELETGNLHILSFSPSILSEFENLEFQHSPQPGGHVTAGEHLATREEGVNLVNGGPQ